MASAARPFAMLPHDIAADPRLSPTDVRVLLALLYFAKADPSCWPSDPSIAARIGRSVGTVQRSLRKLVALGLVDRKPADNATGRVIDLLWRRRATPLSSALAPPVSSARDDGRRDRDKERPGGWVGSEYPPPPAGEPEDAPASAEDLARFEAWANGRDPVMARFGRAALALAGVTAEPTAESPAEAPPEATVEPEPRKPATTPVEPPAATRAPAVEPRPGPRPARGFSPAGEIPPRPSRRAALPRRVGVRHALDPGAGPSPPAALPVWMVPRRSP